MDVLFRSPLGALLAKPWVDQAGLFGLKRWYFPLSRLWAAANAAGDETARFRDEIGAPVAAWPESYLRSVLARHAARKVAAEAARSAWETALFDDASDEDGLVLDHRRRATATRHLATRASFYPLLFPTRPPSARWEIDQPADVEHTLGPAIARPDSLYDTAVDVGTVAVSRPVMRDRLREYWLRAPTPAPRLGQRPGSEALYARVVEPADAGPCPTLIFGSGLCLEFELLTVSRGPATRLAELGWRVVEPISPYHGLRAMPGRYGGEPFFAAGPTSSIDLIAGQAIESALLIAWCHQRFGGKVGLAGISMTSFVAQQAASRCHLWPAEARPDGVMLISHSGRIEDVTFGGALAVTLGLDRALARAGWSREALAHLSELIDPTADPAIAPANIVSVLGETDRWVPYDDGLAVAQRWRLPDANVFRYPLGHLGMPVQLTRDAQPFERLRQVLAGA
ncbi:hypothetical protein [Reyranella soli]|uniref:Alpha/beta hydrolase n=1 Tax=Reyranella soli TaxID=1230389 RepID=A0A512NJV7_9HYPH|nr:hypothetical protein [Reyranella soli]GEP59205.1 hypothetical protein RSO01_63710 [Reyranella soli]